MNRERILIREPKKQETSKESLAAIKRADNTMMEILNVGMKGIQVDLKKPLQRRKSILLIAGEDSYSSADWSQKHK